MANINFKKIEIMAKVHPPQVIRNRIMGDLQVDESNDIIEEFIKLVCAKERVPDSIKEEIDLLAKDKYKRMEKKGMSKVFIDSIRGYDHLDMPQKDYKPIVDPSSYFINPHGAGDYIDCVINDKSSHSNIPNKKSYERAKEFRKEAENIRLDFFSNLLNMETNIQNDKIEDDTAPSTISANDKISNKISFNDMKDTPEVLSIKDYGKLENTHIGNIFYPKCILEDKMYIIDNFLPNEQCDQLIDKLQFSQDEIIAKDNFVKKEIQSGRVIMRTSLRRKFINPELAKSVWYAIKQFMPQTLKDGRNLEGIRSAMNFYRYAPGEYFDTHIDGGYLFKKSRIFSEYTFVLYLNTCDGGSTRFCDIKEWQNGIGKISAKQGKLAIFRQRDMKHCGLPVESGYKYIIQGMIMYSGNKDLKPSDFHSTACIC